MADIVKLWVCDEGGYTPQISEYNQCPAKIRGGLDAGQCSEKIKRGESITFCTATPGYFIPTADIRIKKCGKCKGKGYTEWKDRGVPQGSFPCPDCPGTGKFAQIPLTAEMLKELQHE